MKRLFGAIVAVVALSGCNKHKEIVLQQEIDSLRLEVSISKQMNATLQRIGSMMDSVDALRMEFASGHSNNPDRLRQIHKYVASMQSRSNEIEHELEKGTGASFYNEIITKLTRDLSIKTLVFNTLAEQVALQKGINDTLRMTVENQATEIHDGAALIDVAKQDVLRLDEELKQLTEEVKRLIADARMNNTDSYDERALALEDAAKRTHLAIKKSKNF